MTQVIYKIINLVNDKFYVGSTTNKRERFRTHRNKLRRGVHHCAHLQAAWNKYGEEKFDFCVVQEVPHGQNLQEAEDQWLSEHYGKPYCYNTGKRSGAPWRGMDKQKHPNFGQAVSESQKSAISATLKAYYAENYYNHPRVGKTHSEETKAKISATKKANPVRYWLAKERSEETKQKIRDAQHGKSKALGRRVSEAGMEKIMAAAAAGNYSHWKGRKHAEESKDKLRKAIYAILPDGTRRDFVGMKQACDELGVFMPTIHRACKTNNVIRSGSLMGWRFAYAQDQIEELVLPSIPPEYAHLPRSRQQAKEEGAKQYFTGIPCDRGHLSVRSTKGTCIECRREDDKLAYQKTKETACKKNV